MSIGPFSFVTPPVRYFNFIGLLRNMSVHPETYRGDKFLGGLWLPGPSGVRASGCPAQFTLRLWDNEGKRKFGALWPDYITPFPPTIYLLDSGDYPVEIDEFEASTTLEEAGQGMYQLMNVRFSWLLSWYKCAKQANDVFGSGPSKGGNVAQPN